MGVAVQFLLWKQAGVLMAAAGGLWNPLEQALASERAACKVFLDQGQAEGDAVAQARNLTHSGDLGTTVPVDARPSRGP